MLTARIRVSLLLAAFALVTTLAYAQSDDWHFSSEGAKALFARSVFAHGYMHGYEEGFHNGDVDLQMGRAFREIKSQEKYKKPCGYRNEFGDHGRFDSGYRRGYAVGYIDAYAGRAFRAMQLVRLANAEKWPTSKDAPDEQFDRAFISGYNAGRQLGLQEGRGDAKTEALDSAACQSKLQHAKAGPEYCTMYQNGYQVGYSDGYDNQREAGPVFARK